MLLFYLPVFIATSLKMSYGALSMAAFCPYFRSGPSLKLLDLVGTWLTVYTQPDDIDCFTLHIRATTERDRRECAYKYGNFSGDVSWDKCLLELQSPFGKHYLQGDGSEAGLLDNVIIYINETTSDSGKYTLVKQSADQWLHHRLGSWCMVVARDCQGVTTAAFSRAPGLPPATLVHEALKRSGVRRVANDRLLCGVDDIINVTTDRY